MTISFISSLLRRDNASKPAQSTQQLRYADIPAQPDHSLSHLAYPQLIGVPVTPQSPEFFCRRYAVELHQLLDGLPLSKADIDQLIMPLINSLIEHVNVLPASEGHHHSGVGGLFIHSIQSATAAIVAAEKATFDSDRPLDERYHNKNRWIVAAATTAIAHDIGKIFDMDIVGTNGLHWNPAKETFKQWLQNNGMQDFFVIWRPDRVHKRHELRSIRLMYRSLLPHALVAYLSETTGDVMLGAMDDAIATASGPLASVLRSAEAASIEMDATDRRHLGGRFTETSSPILMPIVTAIRELIGSKKWSINSKDARLFVTDKGTFLQLTPATATQIYEAACGLNAPYVPGTPEGLARAFLDCQIAEPNPEAADPAIRAFWELQLPEPIGLRYSCVKLTDPLQFFPAGGLPPCLSMEHRTVLAPLTAGSTTPASSTIVTKSLLAPTRDFGSQTNANNADSKHEVIGREIEERQSAELPLLTEDEFRHPSSSHLSADQSLALVNQVVRTACAQLKSGGGFLVGKVQHHEDGGLSASMAQAADFLLRRGFDENTSKLLFSLCTPPSTMKLDIRAKRFLASNIKNSTNH